MQFPTLSEVWIRTFHRTYHRLVAPWIALIPFSITELLWLCFYLFIFWMMITIVRALRKKHWVKVRDTSLNLSEVTLALLTLYVATAGVAYARLPVAIPQYTEPVSYTEYESVITLFIDDFNEVSSLLEFHEDGSVINPHSWDTLSALVQDQFQSLETGYFDAYSTRIKPMLFSFLYAEFHITGMHFTLSGEALVNRKIPDAIVPFTIAHELAHAKGVMREQDANLVAMYITLTSDDPFVRYSGYFNTFYALLNLARYMGDDQAYARLYQTLHPAIKRDYQYQGEFWGNYTLLNDIGTWINDVYLRIMGNDGVSSYVDVPITGTVVEGDQTIQVITQFSPYQQLYFYLYFQALNT